MEYNNSIVSQVRLYGIDDILSGYEDKIMPCLPIISLDNKIAFVRNVFWSIDGSGLQFIADPDILENDITTLELNTIIEIKPEDIVILVGPLFYENLLKLNFETLFPRLEIIQDNFRIFICTEERYEQIEHDLLVKCIQDFDAKFRSLCLSGQYSSNGNKDAITKILELWDGIPSQLDDKYFVRKLAFAKYLKKDLDDYRLLLEICMSHLEKDKETVKDWVSEYLDSMGYSDNSSIISLMNEQRFLDYLKSIEEQNWRILYRNSNYFSGNIFSDPKKVNDYFFKFLVNVRNSIEQYYDEIEHRKVSISLQQPEKQNISKLIEEIFEYKIIQLEPAFGSINRGKQASIIAIGEVHKLCVVIPNKYSKDYKNHIKATSLSLLITHCIQHDHTLIIQPHTAIQEEIDNIRDEKDFPVVTASNIEQIQKFLADEDLNAIALVDYLVAPVLTSGFSRKFRFKIFEIEYPNPLPVGYFVPQFDNVYYEIVLDSLMKAFFDFKKYVWQNEFTKLMQKAKITLFPKGPKYYKLDSEENWFGQDIYEDIKKNNKLNKLA